MKGLVCRQDGSDMKPCCCHRCRMFSIVLDTSFSNNDFSDVEEAHPHGELALIIETLLFFIPKDAASMVSNKNVRFLFA